MLENVEEFCTWGQLVAKEEGCRPDLERTSETFEAFRAILSGGISASHPAFLECCEFFGISHGREKAAKLINGLGYAVKNRELRACDYDLQTLLHGHALRWRGDYLA